MDKTAKALRELGWKDTPANRATYNKAHASLMNDIDNRNARRKKGEKI